MARSELLSPQGKPLTLFGNPATLERDSQTLANKMAKDDLRRRLLKGQGTGALAAPPAPTASPEPPQAAAPKATLPTSFLYAVEKNRTNGLAPRKSGPEEDLRAGGLQPVPLAKGSGPNLFAGGAPTNAGARQPSRPDYLDYGPTKDNAAAQAPTADPAAPRADRGLALLDQMQSDRAAGRPVGSSSSLSGPGSTRKLESDAGKAERLARRYMRKFGRFGASAAGGLLEGAANERMGTPGVKSEAYRKADQAIEAEAQATAAQTTAVEKAELQDRLRRIQQGRTGKAGRGKPIKKPQP